MNGPQQGGALSVRQDFSGSTHQLAVSETASALVAAQAKAAVEARYIMAMQRPRNWDQVRQDILRECRRPSFAHNKSTLYRKPIGRGVEGLGVRFVETALRCMTNVLIESSMIYEDAQKEIHRVSVTDLEANITYPQDVLMLRTVERSKPEDDGSYFSMRMNSYNKPVFTVRATEDDLLNKRAALISKAVRTLGLRVIPGDLQDEAEQIIRRIRRDEAAADPDAARKSIIDAFAGINVKAADLARYVGHDIATCSPAELVDLRGLYGAIRDGETTWSAAMASIDDADTPKTGADAVKTAANAKRTNGHGPTPKPKANDGPTMTYAQVRAQIESAADLDALDVAASSITAVADDEQQGELSAIYKARRATMQEDSK